MIIQWFQRQGNRTWVISIEYTGVYSMDRPLGNYV